MSKEIDHGYFTEFKRTPEEENTVKYRKRVRVLEQQVRELQDTVDELKSYIDGVRRESDDCR